MNVEIISVGNELLAGHIVDTNATFLARELEMLGFHRSFRQTVGDDPADIHAALRVALARAEILLFTGGLGPTHDDLTIASIAGYFSAPLVRDEASVREIEQRFAARAMAMPATNLKQADFPAGAKILANACGTAPGIWWDVAGRPEAGRGRLILSFPGVPSEMMAMWRETARARLAPLSGRILATRSVHSTGLGESAAMERLHDLFDFDGAKIFPYANNFQLEVRAIAEGDEPAAPRAAADRAAARVKERLGSFVFGMDDETLEAAVGKLLSARGWTVGVAESCTGGLVSSRLTDVAGSSAWVGMNVVTYSYAAKRELLGVAGETLERFGAVSAECVREMAAGIRRIAHADISLAISGIAGPGGGLPGKPVGLVFLAAEDERGTVVRMHTLPPGTPRTGMKLRFSQLALDLLRRRLEGIED